MPDRRDSRADNVFENGKHIATCRFMEIQTLVDNFNTLPNWEQRYDYIIEHGRRLGILPESEKEDDAKVRGCMSDVWIVGDFNDGALIFRGECDTPIIRGVVALLVEVYSGRTPQEILALDPDEIFSRTHLFDHLSPSRHVGVYAIVHRLRMIAREYVNLA